MVDVSFDGDEEVVRRISSVNCQVDEKSVVKKLPSRKSHRTNTKPKKNTFQIRERRFWSRIFFRQCRCEASQNEQLLYESFQSSNKYSNDEIDLTITDVDPINISYYN